MSSSLTPAQSAALFDILTHYDTYAEIREFRHPNALEHYGPPFSVESGKPSTSPGLQILITKFLLILPGLKNLPEDFWKVQCHDIIQNFERANLSESYDKGIIGSRKTLATAISALIEYPVRGVYGGFAKVDDRNREYDTTKAEDLSRAFRDFIDECIYGNILEEMVKKTAETDDLEDHDVLTKAVHEFVLVNLASFMHYTLVLSPKGQYLLKLIDSANKLVPYMLVKQTLRIGNVATMMSAMVKLGLAKMSVTSFTNWMGLTANQDEGMNLMQQIIYTVLHWDIKDLDSRALKIEKDKLKISKEQFKALKEYSSQPREKQEQIRSESEKHSISIAIAVLRDANVDSKLNDTQHEQALEYLSAHLSIRDRKEIVQVLCYSTPDYFTQSVRELIDAYEPVIRKAHEAVNLSGTVGDMEYFLRDMIKLAKINTGKDGKAIVPTVGDFVQLLRKHQYSTHTFIHQCCKNGPEVTSWYLEWGQTAASQFRREPKPDSNDSSSTSEKPKEPHSGAGSLTNAINDLFSSLSEEQQKKIRPVLDAQIIYLDEMHSASAARLASVIKCPPSKNPAIAKILSASTSRPNSRPNSRAASPVPWSRPANENNNKEPPTSNPTPPTINASATSNPNQNDPSTPPPLISSDPGPGAYLARWQDLLDKTPITPLKPQGKVLAASSPAVVEASATDVDGVTMVEFGEEEKKGDKIRVEIDKSQAEKGAVKGGKPDVRVVIDALGKQFRELLGKEGCTW